MEMELAENQFMERNSMTKISFSNTTNLEFCRWQIAGQTRMDRSSSFVLKRLILSSFSDHLIFIID